MNTDKLKEILTSSDYDNILGAVGVAETLYFYYYEWSHHNEWDERESIALDTFQGRYGRDVLLVVLLRQFFRKSKDLFQLIENGYATEDYQGEVTNIDLLKRTSKLLNQSSFRNYSDSVQELEGVLNRIIEVLDGQLRAEGVLKGIPLEELGSVELSRVERDLEMWTQNVLNLHDTRSDQPMTPEKARMLMEFSRTLGARRVDSFEK